jgi:hypothetical protein
MYTQTHKGCAHYEKSECCIDCPIKGSTKVGSTDRSANLSRDIKWIQEDSQGNAEERESKE